MRLWFFVAGGVFALAIAQPARAQGEPSIMDWRIIQPQVQPSRAAPQTYRARRRYDAPRLQFHDDPTLGLYLPDMRLTTPAEAPPARTRIAVIGDSLADALASGMIADPGMAGELDIRPKTISASGLVRDDFHDWPQTAVALLRETPPPAALVVMLGLNDRQPIRAGGASLEPLGEAWRAAYLARVDALIQTARSARIPLIWVGLPPMRSQRLSTELATINDLIRTRVNAASETFVDVFDGFADPAGGFAATGPDVIGDTVRLRGPDGIHFSPAGQRKLAFFVERPLRRRIGDVASLAAPFPAIPPSPATPGHIALPPPDPATATPPVIRQRDAIGETRPIAPAVSGVTLIDRNATPPADPATRSLFDRGLSPAPRPGRSDDFRWR